MKVATPMISWHAREPVLSLDMHPDGKLATAGADKFVRVWEVLDDLKVKVLANLNYHTASANIVRFSPNGKMLASAGDDGMIFIYEESKRPDDSIGFGEEKHDDVEHWVRKKALRGHLGDVYSLCWSPNGTGIFTGSVDNKTILWDLEKGTALQYFSDHSSYVQGVAWDPLSRMIVSQGADRSCRVYSLRKGKKARKSHNRFKMAATIKRRLFEDRHITTPQKNADNLSPNPGRVEGKRQPTGHNLFGDETVPTFFRRLAFSPDGVLLLTPTGVVPVDTPEGKQTVHALHVFHRDNLKRPVFYFPFEHATCAVRFSPIVYKLHQGVKEPWTNLPYRMVFAVASLKRVAFFDTQSPHPFSIVENLHYAAITDLTWSIDGLTLLMSSQDGYCSILKFEIGQIGDRLSDEEYKKHFSLVLDAAKRPVTSVEEQDAKENQSPQNSFPKNSPVQKRPRSSADGDNSQCSVTPASAKLRKITPIVVTTAEKPPIPSSRSQTISKEVADVKPRRKIQPIVVHDLTEDPAANKADSTFPSNAGMETDSKQRGEKQSRGKKKIVPIVLDQNYQ